MMVPLTLVRSSNKEEEVQWKGLSPDPTILCFQDFELQGEMVSVRAFAIGSERECPKCSTLSQRVHSRYARRLADVPCFGKEVRLNLMVKRFFCLNPSCEQRIFAERLGTVAQPYARSTNRFQAAVTALGFSVGGRGGSRLGARLGIGASPSSVLRRLREAPMPKGSNPRVVGIDDWAFRKGDHYGTIVVDLQKHRVLALLPSRSAEATQKWLEEHPGLQVVSRDRSPTYARAASEGAPQAIQVADRWHLVQNLAQAMERVLQCHKTALREASAVRNDKALELLSECETQPPSPGEVKKEAAANRLAERRARYDDVQRLHEQGKSQTTIALTVGLSRGTVRSYLRSPFPDGKRPNRRQKLDRYREQLWALWEGGVRDATLLYRELKGQGFAGSLRSVQRYVKTWREPEASRRTRRGAKSGLKRPPSKLKLTPRKAVWLLMETTAPLRAEEERIAEHLLELSPPLKKASGLAKEFQKIVRNREAGNLDDWMRRAQGFGGPLASFTAGLRRDLSAVRAALSLPWSNGQTEGQVNRLKMLKRQMFGRANFDLLERRVLWASAYG